MAFLAHEFEFRFNNRKNRYLFRDTLMRLTKGDAAAIQQTDRLDLF